MVTVTKGNYKTCNEVIGWKPPFDEANEGEQMKPVICHEYTEYLERRVEELCELIGVNHHIAQNALAGMRMNHASSQVEEVYAD